MTINSRNQFVDFLNHTVSQKEVSVIIAKDNNEQHLFQEELDREGFRQAIDVSEIIKRNKAFSKVYFMVRDKFPKDIYDFLLQYPTGQVEIFDKSTMSSKTYTPVYKGTSIVLIVTRDSLRAIQKEGFQLLEYAGVAYQN